MFSFHTACAYGMQDVVRAKASMWADHGSARDVMIVKKTKNLSVEEIAGRPGVLIEMDKYLLRRTGNKHQPPMSDKTLSPATEEFLTFF